MVDNIAHECCTLYT